VNIVRCTLVVPRGERILIGARPVPKWWSNDDRDLAMFATSHPGWGLLTMGYQERSWRSAKAELVRLSSVGEWS